ncbi:MAG: acyl-CoA thioesterase [Deltaproteobacteria bacterium]|nr:acyl-CoA thioesterase [Deltaproteobacteria bacterium]
MECALEAKREASVRLMVPFYDLDPMQVVFHGNYLKYFERARQALFDAAGLDPYRAPRDGDVVFPVVRTQVKHVRPLRFRDEFDCTARLVDARSKIVIDFEIRLAAGGALCARGRTEQVAVRLPSLALELRIPADVRRALGAD